MAVFQTAYYHPMDREYTAPTPGMGTNDVDYSVKDIGQSIVSGIGGALHQHLAAKIRAGTQAVELEFTGAGSTRGQQHTPDVYGQDQRRAIRELATLNKINLTTHATMAIMGVTGVDQQNNFSKEQQKAAVDEVKRAIKFAAEAAGGGAVTVHSGEFQRSISDLKSRDYKEGVARSDGTPLFVNYHDEKPEETERRGMIYGIDKRTGLVRFSQRRSMEITIPVYKTVKKGQTYTDINGNQVTASKDDENIYLDYYNKQIPINSEKDLTNRVPEFDPRTGEFNVKTVNWDYFKEEAKLRNALREKELGRKLNPEERLTEEEAFARAQLGVQAARARGFAFRGLENFQKLNDEVIKLQNAKEIYEKLEKSASPEELERFKIKLESELGRLLPEEYVKPTEAINKRLSAIKTEIEHLKHLSSAEFAEAEDAKRTSENIVSVYKYGVKEAQKAYAEIGLEALNQTKANKLKKPVFVAIEHIFPESYGGHPQELKEIVLGARKEMQRRLEQWGYSKEEAKKKAEDHIKGTLDIGHLNMWRKYWNPKGKNPEENEEEFKKWAVSQVEDLAKDKIWGNVHLTDNFGYGDDHLAPGMGNAPTREIAKVLKKHGYEGPLIVEPGADASVDLSDFHGTMKAWRFFGSPIYGLTAPVHDRMPWESVQYGWFGQTRSPYFIFGAYAPSQEWKLWTEVPLE